MVAKHRVLVVDDNEITLKLTSHIFERAGYEVYSAQNGKAGLSKVGVVKPDLIILDVMMPDVSGLEVARRIRSQPATASIPIIMLSARGEVDDKVGGFQAGADDYVQKPVAPKELLARAAALLHRHQRAPRGKVIGVVGAKGGLGTTSLAVNIAQALTSHEHQVVFAELRDTPGTAATMLGMTPTYDIDGLLALEANQLDDGIVAKLILRHESGMMFLPGPQQPTHHPMTPEHAKVIIRALLDEMDYVVLDIPPINAVLGKPIFELCDHLLLVAEREISAINCARSVIAACQAWNIADRMSMVLISRAPAIMHETPAELENRLSVRLAAVIPPAAENFHEAMLSGVPIVVSKPDSVPAGIITRIAHELITKPEGADPASPPQDPEPVAPRTKAPRTASTIRRLKPR